MTVDQTFAPQDRTEGVSELTDAELYRRGAETLLASWEQYARGAAGANVWRSAGVASAVFPNEPERGVYNNALLDVGLDQGERDEAISAMETFYEAAGVTRFAAWVHENDDALRYDLMLRGYTIDDTTRAMGMTLNEIHLPRPEVELGSICTMPAHGDARRRACSPL
jgi:hypothetical protein